MGVYILNNWALQDLIARAVRVEPEDVYGQDNVSVMRWRLKLLRMVTPIVQFKNVPESWDIDYLKTILFINGFICITDTSAGILPLETGLAGQNVFRHPTTCVIANPVLGSFDRTIDIDCVLLKLQYAYSGIVDELDEYSYRLAACDASIDVNLINSRVSFIAEAGTKAQAETIKAMYTQMSKGKPCVVWKKNPGDSDVQIYYNKVKENYVADLIQDTKRTIINEFLTLFGINNANTDKRERLVTDEVNANNEELDANIGQFVECITDGVNRINKMFNLNIAVDFPFYKKRKSGDDSDNTD